jgi:hypothetical protein
VHSPSRTTRCVPMARATAHTTRSPLPQSQRRRQPWEGFRLPALLENSRVSPPHRPREAGLAHPAETSRSDLLLPWACFRAGGLPNPRPKCCLHGRLLRALRPAVCTHALDVLVRPLLAQSALPVDGQTASHHAWPFPREGRCLGGHPHPWGATRFRERDKLTSSRTVEGCR